MVDSKITIAGNLTRDPELKVGRNNGAPFAVLALAVNTRRFLREAGGWVTTGTTYFDVLCWGSMGANALRTFSKGDPVVAHGRFRLREWTADSGQRFTPTVDADAVGPDISFGTATFTRGNADYGLDRVMEYVPSEIPPDDEAPGHLADEDGVVDDEQAGRIHAAQREEEDAAGPPAARDAEAA